MVELSGGLSLSTLPLSSLLQLKEATGRASVPVCGAGGLSRLRWPPGHREVPVSMAFRSDAVDVRVEEGLPAWILCTGVRGRRLVGG